jgi:hypothetical protein
MTCQKNASITLAEDNFEENFALGEFVGEKSKSLLCRLEDGIFSPASLIMNILYVDPLMKRVPEIIDRVVETVRYNDCYSSRMHKLKLHSRRPA